jgi:protein gp37
VAENSSIEWTDATWNPVTGCSVVSPGCTNCYAMKLAGTRLQHHQSRAGLTTATKAGPVWNGQVRFNSEWLDQPLRWHRPRRIFVCAHGDMFAEGVPDAWIDQIFAAMALAPHHTFQVLTKRSKRMLAYFDKHRAEAITAGHRTDLCPQRIDDAAADLTGSHGGALEEAAWPLPNVWLGVSAEDQPRADERVPDLILTPAAVRFVSVEPMLGPVDLTDLPAPKTSPEDDVEDWRFDGLMSGEYYWFRDGEYTEGGDGPDRPALDWIIVGGESGGGARPMHPDWARRIRDDCAASDVAFFFKQWGAWKEAFHDQDGPQVHEVEVGSEEAEAFYCLVDAKQRAFLNADGDVFRGHPDNLPEGRWRMMETVGKKAAGRHLDGVEHNAMPAPMST